jgi:peptidoglycan/xylan/chitin deacetylase (PgdA/CDA1 family)
MKFPARRARVLAMAWVLLAPLACLTPGVTTVRTEASPGEAAATRAVARVARLPAPPGASGVPRPAGPPGNLKVLDWAGFKSALTYTIDDGQPSQVEHYAELQATGVRMTFFLNSTSTWTAGFTSTFKQAVRDGHEIGNHTVHHCHAQADGTLYNTSGSQRTPCPGENAAVEYDDCTAFITSTLGQPQVWTTASPFGDAGYATAAKERFFLNRGVMDGTVGPNDGTDAFDLPMWGPAENDTAAAFNARIDSARRTGRWLIVLLHSIAPTTARWYATVDISAIAGSIEHARSLNDVWIDTMANVGAYWRGQKLLSSVTPTAAGDTRTWTWSLPAHFPPGRTLRVKVDGGTLSQAGQPLPWDGHGYYEIALDAGSLTLSP